MEEIKTPEPEALIQPLTDETNKVPKIPIDWNSKTALIVVLIVFLGLFTGYAIYAYRTAGTVRLSGKDITVVKTASEEGVKDASTFRDTATGMVIENDGKLTNEGTHILTRGDASQNVYLTSSVIDLSKYPGKKVQVWGETFKGQKAGWLMDIGRIKVIN